MQNSTEDRVRRIVTDYIARHSHPMDPGPAPTITNETSFEGDLGADSLTIVELTMSLEEEFDIHLSDKEVEKVQTVQDMINLVTGLLH
jgi:acyl carrier protein